MDRDAEPNTNPGTETVWTGTLTAGQVMHIPRGWWHQATREHRGEGYSLHATFGLTQRTGIDYLTWITDQARADVRFRRDLGQHPADDQHQQLADAAAGLLAGHSPADFLAARRREHAPARHATTFGIFGPPRSVVCVTSFPPELDVSADVAIVRAAGKKITIPAAALPALRALLSGHPVDLPELAAATGIDTTALAAALTNAGVCAETTPALAAGYTGMIALTGTTVGA
jgi:hypothetical protein